ncbi:5605_t:CDS:10 [Entrophospora sp. SA101]|nr:5605_t:CDS:10 [Entrophospora sp. SA101]
MVDSTNQQVINNYQLGDCLGKGAFGSVYRALNWETGEAVAVKKIKLSNIPKSDLNFIMTEIDLLKNLNHPNIVKYKGFVKTREFLFIILEYCENGSLHNICKKFGKFPENLVAVYISQVLEGLLYLHEQGVIHRDIKGANILTTKEGLVKLADFGVATKTTTLGDFGVVGSPYWMAPEIIELSGATTSSDIWSVGCVVIELLEGKPPYHHLDPMPALFRIVQDEHPPLPESASPAVKDFLMQCFHKDKYEETIKSVQEWNKALKASKSNIKLPPAFNRRRKSEQIKLQLLSLPSPDNANRKKSIDQVSIVDNNWDNFVDLGSKNLTVVSKEPMESSQINGETNINNTNGSLKSSASFEPPSPSPSPSLTSSPLLQQQKRSKPLQIIRPTSLSAQQQQKQPIKPIYSTSLTENHITIFSSSPNNTTNARPKSPYPPNLFKQHRRRVSDLEANKRPFSYINGLQNSTSLSSASSLPDDKPLPPLPRYSKSPNSAGLGLSLSSRVSAPVLPSIEIPDSYYDKVLSTSATSNMSNASPISPLRDTPTGGDKQSLMIKSRPTNNSWLAEDISDEDDPFAEIEEKFDEMDMEAYIARDKYAHACSRLEELINALLPNESEERLLITCGLLIDLLHEHKQLKSHFIIFHGVIPIIEILEICVYSSVLTKLLRIINIIIEDNINLQENLCLVGGIPVIMNFTLKRYSYDIRLEAATFIKHICHTSPIVLQMFVSCRGLKVLVEFLQEDYNDRKELVWIAVNGICSVFELQSPTPKNDFCRLLAKNGLLDPLANTLHDVIKDEDEKAFIYINKIINIFLQFSQADTYVTEVMATKTKVISRIFEELDELPANMVVSLLKCIKNMSMNSNTLDALQKAGAIQVLTAVLDKQSPPYITEISNQVLNTMFNLCRINKSRQEEAAKAGVIPHLQYFASNKTPLKQFSLPILCDMVHTGELCRDLLWKHDGLQFYLELLIDPYWQVNALEAILAWLQEETQKVEPILLQPKNVGHMLEAFVTAKANSFENVLEPLHMIAQKSPSLSCEMAQPKFFKRLLQRLSHPKAVVRLNLLRILKTVCDSHPQREDVIAKYELFDVIDKMSKNDQAVLIRDLGISLSSLPVSNPPATSLSKDVISEEEEYATSFYTNSHVPFTSFKDNLVNNSALPVEGNQTQIQQIQIKRRKRALSSPITSHLSTISEQETVKPKRPLSTPFELSLDQVIEQGGDKKTSSTSISSTPIIPNSNYRQQQQQLPSQKKRPVSFVSHPPNGNDSIKLPRSISLKNRKNSHQQKILSSASSTHSSINNNEQHLSTIRSSVSATSTDTNTSTNYYNYNNDSGAVSLFPYDHIRKRESSRKIKGIAYNRSYNRQAMNEEEETESVAPSINSIGSTNIETEGGVIAMKFGTNSSSATTATNASMKGTKNEHMDRHHHLQSSMFVWLKKRMMGGGNSKIKKEKISAVNHITHENQDSNNNLINDAKKLLGCFLQAGTLQFSEITEEELVAMTHLCAIGIIKERKSQLEFTSNISFDLLSSRYYPFYVAHSEKKWNEKAGKLAKIGTNKFPISIKFDNFSYQKYKLMWNNLPVDYHTRSFIKKTTDAFNYQNWKNLKRSKNFNNEQYESID